MRTPTSRRNATMQANQAIRQFGYDAVDQSQRRRQAPSNLRSEDVELNVSRRRKLIAQSLFGQLLLER